VSAHEFSEAPSQQRDPAKLQDKQKGPEGYLENSLFHGASPYPGRAIDTATPLIIGDWLRVLDNEWAKQASLSR